MFQVIKPTAHASYGPRGHGPRHVRVVAAHAGLLALAAMAWPDLAVARWRFRLDAHASLPVGDPQSREFGPGGGLGLAAEWMPEGHVGLVTRLQGLALSPSNGALPDGYGHPGVGTLVAWTVGVRVRPFGVMFPRVGDGLWLEVQGGGGITGSAVRPLVGARLGFGFNLRSIGLGPYVGYTRVFELGSTLLPGDAQSLSAGLELTIGLAAPQVAGRPVRVPIREPVRQATESSAPPCPAVQHAIAGDANHDGCPDNDADEDRIADAIDRCVTEPEDLDGFEDADGCPDPDNDRDNIPDTRDACPNEPETINGVADTDGCPDHAEVEVTHGRIASATTVEFSFNSARVLPESDPLLRATAAVLVEHPEYRTVYIEGHSDELGDESYNYNLSYQRARAVLRALVRLGIERSRLVPMGFGRSAPLDRSHNVAARARNRRVEFVVDGHRTPGHARVSEGYIDVQGTEVAP